MTNLLYWVGLVIMMSGVALAVFTRHERLGGWLWALGYGVAISSVWIDGRPDIIAKIISSAIFVAVAFVAWWGPRDRERRASHHAQQAVDEGQGDGGVPQETQGGTHD